MKETSNIEALGHGWNHDISRCSKARLFSWRAQPRSASSRTWFHSKQSDRLMWLIISCKKWKKWNTKYTGSVSFQKMVVTWQQLPLRAWEPTVLQLLGIPTHLHIEDQHALASPTPRSAKGVADLAGGRSCWQFAVRCMCGMHRHPWNRIFCLLTFCSANPRE